MGTERLREAWPPLRHVHAGLAPEEEQRSLLLAAARFSWPANMHSSPREANASSSAHLMSQRDTGSSAPKTGETTPWDAEASWSHGEAWVRQQRPLLLSTQKKYVRSSPDLWQGMLYHNSRHDPCQEATQALPALHSRYSTERWRQQLAMRAKGTCHEGCIWEKPYLLTMHRTSVHVQHKPRAHTGPLAWGPPPRQLGQGSQNSEGETHTYREQSQLGSNSQGVYSSILGSDSTP